MAKSKKAASKKVVAKKVVAKKEAKKKVVTKGKGKVAGKKKHVVDISMQYVPYIPRKIKTIPPPDIKE